MITECFNHKGLPQLLELSHVGHVQFSLHKGNHNINVVNSSVSVTTRAMSCDVRMICEVFRKKSS